MIVTDGDIPFYCLIFVILVVGLYISSKATIRTYRRNGLKLWLAGLIGWFGFQFIYSEFLSRVQPPFFWVLASVPISLFLALIFYLLKQPSIAAGIFTAIVGNAIILVGLDRAGFFYDDGVMGGIGVTLLFFPTFIWCIYMKFLQS